MPLPLGMLNVCDVHQRLAMATYYRVVLLLLLLLFSPSWPALPTLHCNARERSGNAGENRF